LDHASRRLLSRVRGGSDLVSLDLQPSHLTLLMRYLDLLGGLDAGRRRCLYRVKVRPVPGCLFLPAHFLG
jgi:hypothetical protein